MSTLLPGRRHSSESNPCEAGQVAAKETNPNATRSMPASFRPKSPAPISLKPPSTVAAERPRSEILQAQHFGIVVVGENLGVPAPIDDGLQHPFRVLLRQVILELAHKSCGGGAVARTLVEDAPDMGSERDVLQERFGKHRFALEHVSV